VRKAAPIIILEIMALAHMRQGQSPFPIRALFSSISAAADPRALKVKALLVATTEADAEENLGAVVVGQLIFVFAQSCIGAPSSQLAVANALQTGTEGLWLGSKGSGRTVVHIL
jgi:hypothetical protein